MNAQSHKAAALKHLELAKKTELELADKDENIKRGLRTVTAQNYFYAGVQAIEAVLAKENIHPLDHRERQQLIQSHHSIFKDPSMLVLKHQQLMGDELNYRRKVAYRGENGFKFEVIKEFAEIAIKEICA